MKKLQIFSFILILLIFIPGCENGTDKKPVSIIDRNKEPEVLIFDAEKIPPEKVDHENSSGTHIILHPDMKGKSKIEEVLAYTENTADDAEIKMDVISKFMDSSRYYLYLKIENTGKGGKNINVYTFYYDKTGTIYKADVSSKYVAPKETWILYKNYYRNRRDVKWVFKATRRK